MLHHTSVREIDASFPGGKEDLELLVNDAVEQAGIDIEKHDSSTTCVMQITVDAEGVVTKAKALGLHPDSIANIALKAVEEGPHWRPAIVDGTPVESIIEQTVDISLNSSEANSPSLNN